MVPLMMMTLAKNVVMSKSHIAPDFDGLDLRNAVVPLMML